MNHAVVNQVLLEFSAIAQIPTDMYQIQIYLYVVGCTKIAVLENKCLSKAQRLLGVIANAVNKT